MAGKILKTLGFLGAFAAGILGYSGIANAQHLIVPPIKEKPDTSYAVQDQDTASTHPAISINNPFAYIAPDTSKARADSSTVAKEKPKHVPRKWIKAKEDLTVVDKSRVLYSDFSVLDGRSTYFLPDKLGSEEVLSYRVLNPHDKRDAKVMKNDLKRIKDSRLRARQKSYQKEARCVSYKDLEAFNKALGDGVLEPEEISGLEKTTYIVEIKTPTQSVIRVIRLRPGKLEQAVAVAEGDTSKTKTLQAVAVPYVPVQPAVSKVDSSQPSPVKLAEETKAKEKTKKVRFGLTLDAGSKRELSPGFSVEIPLTQRLSVEGFANYNLRNALKSSAYFSRESERFPERERVLVGDGVYKTRTDKVTNSEEERPRGEAGLRVVCDLGGGLEASLGAAFTPTRLDVVEKGTSTIIHERNNHMIGTPKVIENTREKKNQKGRDFVSPEFQLRANLLRNVSINATVEKTGEHVGGKFGVGVKF